MKLNRMKISTHIQWLKIVFAVFSISSIVLGGWMIIAPNGFWNMMGIHGGNIIIQVLYGGAICGEAVIFGLGARKPVPYMTVMHYLIPYKCIGCFALIPRLFVMDIHWGAWAIVFAWLAPAVIAAIVYPWGRWTECVAAELSKHHG